MKDTTLVIMAAGIGSRFGEGIKQLEPMGPNGEIIMDYSIYDALKAGFNKIVFVIRKDLEKTFKEIIGSRIEKVAKVEYVFQETDNLPSGFSVPEGRTKPWGTGQAILVCKDVVKEPFLVINADDYYGKEGFKKIHDYLVEGKHGSAEHDISMAGFILGNTLSDNGAVTRGICKVDEQKKLIRIQETPGLIKTGEGRAAYEKDGQLTEVDVNGYVSMNMWGFAPEFLEELEDGFIEFLSGLGSGGTTKEYLLPMEVDKLVQSKRAAVTVLETQDKWFGVTYKADKQDAAAAIHKLIAEGEYPEKLYETNTQ